MVRNAAYAAFFLLVFTLPAENVLVLPGIGTASRLAGLLALPLCLLYLVWHEKFRFHWLLFWFALFVSWAALTMLWSLDDKSLVRVVTLFQLLLLVWLVIQMVETPRHAEMAFKAYMLGAFAAAFLTIQDYFQGQLQLQIQLQGELDAYQRYSASGFDPNDIALILALGVPMAAFFVLRGSRLWAPVGLLYVPVALYAILLTASRTGFIAGVIGCFYPLLLLDHRPARAKVLVFAAIALAGAAAAAAYLVPEASWTRLATTWGEVSDGTLNSRTEIWAGGLNVFDRHAIFGVGVGSFAEALNRQEGMDLVAHNAFIATATELGLIGLVIFVIVLGTVVSGLRRLPVLERRTWYVLLALLGLAFMTMNWEPRKQSWLILALAASHSLAWARHGVGGRAPAAPLTGIRPGEPLTVRGEPGRLRAIGARPEKG